MRLDDIDLADLDRFVDGFPHDVFAFVRQRGAPVRFHPPTAHTPGGEGSGSSRGATVEHTGARHATVALAPLAA